MGIEIYGRSTSYNVQKVLWFLDELSLNYKHIECGGKFGGLDTPEFAKRNPLRKVPVLLDNGANVWESNTIIRYLAATYGGELWWSQSPIKRSGYERWMDWSIDKLETAFVGVFWGYYRKPESRRDWDAINKSKNDYIFCLSIIEEQLQSNQYLSGSDISLSDVALGVFIYRLQDIGIGIELSKNTKRWYRNLQSRDGFIRWVMSDFSELKGREDY